MAANEFACKEAVLGIGCHGAWPVGMPVAVSVVMSRSRCQRMVVRLLGCEAVFMQRCSPNQAVKRTVNGVAGSVVFAAAVPPLPSAYLQR